MNTTIHPTWKSHLEEEFKKPYFKQLASFVKQEYTQKKVFPPPKQLFHAFDACPFDDVRVVMLGQDPYHGPGQAHGLCFSVNDGVPIPPSLKNIYKEIRDDIGTPLPTSGNLDGWAKQGVFLLNATLTVEAHKAGSHQNKGWEEFTDAVIQTISDKKQDVVFLLWGSYAQKKGTIIDESKHLVLRAPHPSPLAAYRGFFGCKHFSKTNAHLISTFQAPIEW